MASLFLPCLEPNDAPRALTLAAAPSFAYIGTPLTLPEFVAYIAAYDFGSILPDQIVIHNTAIPDASWAPFGNDSATQWDHGETGLSYTAIRNKRNKQLDHIRDYYVSLGWDAGPHLFFDERWIWLFTPMAEVGIHAKEGNSYRDKDGRLHYSLGCEFVGWFGKRGWPIGMQQNASGAIQALRDRLKTFEIVYKGAITHQPAKHQGSISFHRDYNKPACPGGIITPEYAIPILNHVNVPPTPTIPDPLKAELLPGPNGTHYACSIEVAGFYLARGGVGVYGYPLSSELRATGLDGRVCSYMPCERVCIKNVKPDGVHLSLLKEAMKLRWI